MTHNFPTYDRPPVTEVVLATAFAGVPSLGVAHLGHFWRTKLQDELPDLEEQPPYEPPIESFGTPTPLSVTLELLSGPPSPRLWAKSADGTKLLQLQRGWLAFNWRDAPDSPEPYPRWSKVEALFLKYYGLLCEYLLAEGLGNPMAKQCEVTYINSIAANEVWHDHGELHKVLTLLCPPSGFLRRPETTQMTTSYQIVDDQDRTRGRLHISVQPAFQRANNKPALVLTLTGRGEAFDEEGGGVLPFMQLAHEWVVKGFTSITTEAMHQEWGLHDQSS